MDLTRVLITRFWDLCFVYFVIILVAAGLKTSVQIAMQVIFVDSAMLLSLILVETVLQLGQFVLSLLINMQLANKKGLLLCISKESREIP